MLAESSFIATRLQTFIASALLLSGLASAATLPRDNADYCVGPGGTCNNIGGPYCCEGYCSGGFGLGISVPTNTVFVLLLTQLWRKVLFSVADWFLAQAHKLSLMNRGQMKFSPAIACSYFVSRSCLMNHYGWMQYLLSPVCTMNMSLQCYKSEVFLLSATLPLE